MGLALPAAAQLLFLLVFLLGTAYCLFSWRKACRAKTRLAATLDPVGVEELRSFGAGKRELDSNAHSFGRIEGYDSERRVWSFDLASFEGVIARRAVVDQCLRDRVLAAGGSIWYGAQAMDLRVSGR